VQPNIVIPMDIIFGLLFSEEVLEFYQAENEKV